MTAADRPPGPHPDLDTLADLDAGVLDAATAERVSAHAGGCPRCAKLITALGTVRADLRSLPPPPLPQAVAARLDATVAGLRPTRPAVPGAAGPSADGERTGETAAARPVDLGAARERRRRRSGRATVAAVAAAVALLAAGASVTALVRSLGSGGPGGAATSAGRDSKAATEAGTAPKPATPSAAAGIGAPPTSPAATSAVPSYTRDTLRTSLARIERESAVETTAKAAGSAGAMADPARRQACVQTILGHRGELRAVRRITYEGVPAYLFVFEDGQPHGYVVDLQCGASGGLPATVLDRLP
jgi:hypothetical protein